MFLVTSLNHHIVFLGEYKKVVGSFTARALFQEEKISLPFLGAILQIERLCSDWITALSILLWEIIL